MTPCRRVAATASLIGAVWGCGASTEPNAKVTAMVPSAAFNDAAFSALIAGDSFRPAYRFDTMAAASGTDVGAFSVDLASTDGVTKLSLDGVSWQSPTALAATAPAGIPAGSYDVVVTDPRGSQLRLANGFQSLGADHMPPVVTIENPPTDSLVGEGTTVTVTVSADDGDGLLQALGASVSPDSIQQSVTCAVPADSRSTRCSFDFVAPSPADQTATISISASATDSVGNDGGAGPTLLTVVRRPTLISASRDNGPASGNTPIVMDGSDFIENVTQVLVNGVGVPTVWLSPTMIQATTRPHDPGPAKLRLSNAGALSDLELPYTFIPAPIVRSICPTHGPMTGGTRVEILGNFFRDGQTKISFGGPILDPLSTTSGKIVGLTPAAKDPGTVWLSAGDPVGGSTRPEVQFTYDPVTAADDPDAGVEPPVCNGVP